MGGERIDQFDWAELVASLVVRLGWTWDEVLDQVDMPRLEAIRNFWEDHPPLCDVVASYFGIEPRKKPSNNFDELLAMFPSGVIK